MALFTSRPGWPVGSESDPAAAAAAAASAAAQLEAEVRKARGLVLAWPSPRWSAEFERRGLDDAAIGAHAAAALQCALGLRQGQGQAQGQGRQGGATSSQGLELLSCRSSRWGTDPYARCSYSYVPLGASIDDFAELAKPSWREGGMHADSAARVEVKEKEKESTHHHLFFAGEATSRDDSYTVHGAWLSGMREADRILAEWCPQPQSPQ